MAHIRRLPVVLWLPRYRRRRVKPLPFAASRVPVRWRVPPSEAGRGSRGTGVGDAPTALSPPRPPLHPGTSWFNDQMLSTLFGYGILVVLALLVIVVTAPTPPRPALPTVGRVFRTSSNAAGALHKWLALMHINETSLKDWLIAGAPLIAWADGNLSNPWQVHWRGLAAAGISAVTATPLHNLDELLGSAVPALAAAPLPSTPPRTSSILEETQTGLPGAGSKVWAELGASPVVGLYQTHSHESFWPLLPKGTAAAYSTDWSHTIVQVGWWLAQDLQSYSIPVVQSRVDNMREGTLASYTLSLQTAKTLLRYWPSVRVLLDIHRGNAPLSQTLTTVHGRKTAKILVVVGTNQLMPNPHWQENAAFALKLTEELKTLAPGILRGNGIETVPYQYNQQLLPADVIVEVGGAYNTLSEERQAVAELAAALADLIRAGQIPGQ